MARTIQQIKAAMTQQFMADPTIRDRYGIAGTSTFDQTFSAVSLENIWFTIVASAIWVLESIFDAFRADVDAKVAGAVVASIPWYHKIALEFQYGDVLVFDDATQQFIYPVIDESKRVVKFAACRDLGGGVCILAAGADADGHPEELDADILDAFESYMIQRKPAGVNLQVYSYAPDKVKVSMKIQFDPQVLTASGELIADPSVKPVEAAINTYLENIVYGGVLNKTKLVDAVQGAPGVLDVLLASVSVKPVNSGYSVVVGNNYISYSGSFESEDLSSGIEYVLSI